MEQPPNNTDIYLKEYLTRVLSELETDIANNGKLTKRGVIPEKYIVGKMYYFTQAIAEEAIIDSEGFYGYTSTGWVKL